MKKTRAFTLLELLVSMVILTMLMLILTQSIYRVQDTWKRTKARAEEFREARAAFEAFGRRVSQATLNAYWGYNDPNAPKFYQRQSELHFVSGALQGGNDALLDSSSTKKFCGHGVFFQAPFGYAGDEAGSTSSSIYNGMEDLLNCWGYYVEYNSDLPERPAFLNADTLRNPERKRFRLMEFRQPSEKLELFKMDGATATAKVRLGTLKDKTGIWEWFVKPITTQNSALLSDPNMTNPSTMASITTRPVADNILCAIISPRAPGLYTIIPPATTPTLQKETFLAPNYLYDSRQHQFTSPPATGVDVNVTRHQLPPVLNVTFVALDENSFNGLTNSEIDAISDQLIKFVNDRFKKVALGADESGQLQKDLAELDTFLSKQPVSGVTLNAKIAYRTFTTAIPIRGAKWITEKES